MLKPIGGSEESATSPTASPSSSEAPKPPIAPPISSPPPANLPPAGYRAPAYEPDPAPSKAPLWIGLGLGVVLLGGAATWLLKSDAAPSSPASWTTFRAADGSFVCDVPENWEVRGTGDAASEGKQIGEDNGVRADSGGAHVEVSMSTVAGLVTGQLIFGKDTTPEAMTGSRANGVFTFQRRGLKKRFNGFSDDPIDAPPSKMGGIDASTLGDLKLDIKPDIRIAEFTGKKTGLGLGRPVQGIRACLGGRELIASVVCYCAPKDFPALKPAFLKIVGSVSETKNPSGREMGIPGAGSVPMPNVPGR